MNNLKLELKIGAMSILYPQLESMINILSYLRHIFAKPFESNFYTLYTSSLSISAHIS